MICNDCGGEFILKRKEISRPDVCDPCWDNRGWLLRNASFVGMAAFTEAQRKLRGGRGAAKKYIESLKPTNPPAHQVKRG